jgi:hypothetical protein
VSGEENSHRRRLESIRTSVFRRFLFRTSSSALDFTGVFASFSLLGADVLQ